MKHVMHKKDLSYKNNMLELLQSASDFFARGDYLAAEKIFRSVFQKEEFSIVSPQDEKIYLQGAIHFTKLLLKKKARTEALSFISKKVLLNPRDKDLFLALWDVIKSLPDIDIITLLTTIYKESDYPFLSDILKEQHAKKVYLYFQKKSTKKDRFILSSEYIAAGHKDTALAILKDDMKRIIKLQNKIASERYLFPSTLAGILEQNSK